MKTKIHTPSPLAGLAGQLKQRGRQRRVVKTGGLGAGQRVAHGHARRRSKSPTYRCWQAMFYRCYNRKCPVWKRYGGNGVRVCNRWRLFDNFLADMGQRPDGMTLDRFPDNRGNYRPTNCRWATIQQQQNNKSVNRLITYKGKTQNITEWEKELGMNRCLLSTRLRRGWSIQEAMTVPMQKRKHHGKQTRERH